MPEIIKKNKKTFLSIATLASIVSILTWFGISGPSPVFSHQLTAVETRLGDQIQGVQGDLKEFLIEYHNQKLRRLKQELGDTRLTIIKLDLEKIAIPAYLHKEVIDRSHAIEVQQQVISDLLAKRKSKS